MRSEFNTVLSILHGEAEPCVHASAAEDVHGLEAIAEAPRRGARGCLPVVPPLDERAVLRGECRRVGCERDLRSLGFRVRVRVGVGVGVRIRIRGRVRVRVRIRVRVRVRVLRFRVRRPARRATCFEVRDNPNPGPSPSPSRKLYLTHPASGRGGRLCNSARECIGGSGTEWWACVYVCAWGGVSE